jgi:hypothetical protein
VLPDQEQLQGIDGNKQGIIKDHRRFLDDDHLYQKAGTGDQNKDEGNGGQIACLLCSHRLDELRGYLKSDVRQLKVGRWQRKTPRFTHKVGRGAFLMQSSRAKVGVF